MANFTYIVDDQDPSIEYLCPVTKETVLQSFFNHTWTTIADQSCGAGWFTYKFNGTSVRLAAASIHANHNFSVQIDDSPLLIQNSAGLYESPILAEKEHTVLYAMSDATLYPSFDYLTVTTSKYPSGRTVIVDDEDSLIQYSGTWSTKAPTDLVFDTSSSIPYLNTTHWSNTVGDSITFRFTGSSISVFGVLLNSTAGGNVTATYSIDGNTSSLQLPMGRNQPLPMAKLFHSDLSSGDHTLMINVTSVTGPQALGLDFMLYNATGSLSGPTDSNPQMVPTGATVHHVRKTAVIVGSVVSGVVLVLLLALLFLLFHRRQQRRNQRDQSELAATVVTLPLNGSWTGRSDSDNFSAKEGKFV